MSNPVTKWGWVRHAPVVAAHAKSITGQSDVDADISDTSSFQALASRLPRTAVWLTTPLNRTTQTAEALWTAGAERTQPQVEPALAEQNFGDWTGKTWDDIGENHPFWNAPATTAPPGVAGESFADLCARVANRTQALSQDFAGRAVVCVAHAGTIRAAVALGLGLSPDQALGLDVANVSLTRLDYLGEGNWRVVGVNQVC